MNEKQEFVDKLLAQGKTYGEVARALEDKFALDLTAARWVIWTVEHKGEINENKEAG